MPSALPEALFVDADVLDGRRSATLESSLDGPIHNRLHGIPGEAEKGRRRFHGPAGLQDFDSKRLEEQGESGVLSCPGRHDGLDAMLRAPASGKAGDQLRRELHRVQVPPTPLVGVIGEAAGPAALGAEHAGADVRQADFDSSILDLEVDRLHPPGVIEAEQTGVMR